MPFEETAMKKYFLFALIYLFILALITSCGGGGGGGGAVSFSHSNQLHNGGDAGGWGNGNTTGGGLGGGSASTISAEGGTFTPCDDIDWTAITLTITVTSDGATTTHTFDSGDKDAIAELLTSLKKGDVVSVSVEIEMVDDVPRTSSAGPITIGVGDNHISIPTPYKFICDTVETRNLYQEAYDALGLTAPTFSVDFIGGSTSDICTVNEVASKLPEATSPGFKFDHWITQDGKTYIPGVTKGDVILFPVFKPDYACNYGYLGDIVIMDQQDFNDLMNNHAGENFSGKTIALNCNVSTSTGFTNTTDGFQGTFDGQEHTVTLAVTENSGTYAGLFYQLGSGADIENLTTAGHVTLTTTNGSGGVGGIAGIASGTITIKNCINRAVVSNSDELATTGGIIGKSSFPVTIEQCANKGNVTSGCCRAGGITGETGTSVTISECYNTAQITCTGSVSTDQPKIGGIVGNNTGTIYHCYNTGAIHVFDVNSNGSGYIGGICGVNSSGDIAYCYNTGTLSSDNSDSLGAIHGFASLPNQQACCTNNPSSTDTVSNANTLFPSADSSIWVAGSGGRPRLINNPE